MKIYFSVDMEGITGIVSPEEVDFGSNEFERARRWMTEEVNAAIAGAKEAGGSEFVVNDAHFRARSILLDRLDASAKLIRGQRKPLTMMQGLDQTFQAVVFLGYHGSAGSEGVLSHTFCGRGIDDVRLNGKSVGELEINAAVAAYFSVPLVMVAGDSAAVAQAKRLEPNLVTVCVKEAIDRYTALCLTPRESARMIKEGIKEALHRLPSLRPQKLEPPFTFEIDFCSPASTEAASWMPEIVKKNARTVAYTSNDFLCAYKGFHVAAWMGYGVLNSSY